MNFKFCVLRLILSANTKPRMVTARVVNSRCKGMLLGGLLLGVCGWR